MRNVHSHGGRAHHRRFEGRRPREVGEIGPNDEKITAVLKQLTGGAATGPQVKLSRPVESGTEDGVVEDKPPTPEAEQSTMEQMVGTFSAEAGLQSDVRVLQELLSAVQKGDVEKVRELARPEIASRALRLGLTPLHWTMRAKGDEPRKNALEIAEILIEQRAELDKQDDELRTPLHHAVMNRFGRMIRLLVEKGASKAVTDRRGKTAHEYAVEMVGKEENPAQRERAQRVVDFLKPEQSLH